MNKQSKISIIFIALFVFTSLILTSCGSSSVVQSIKKESLYDRVIRTGKIRCAYAMYPPSCMKDPNTGELCGVGIDALRLVAKKLGLTIELTEEVGWGNMVEGIQTGRYDIMAMPVWTNAHRAKIVDFSSPLFYSPVFAYIKKGDGRFKNHFEKLNSPNVTVATIDGETAEVIAEAELPKAKTLSMPQMTDCTQMLLNVASGKADVTFAEPNLAYLYIKNNPNKLEILDPIHPVRMFPNCWMFGRGEFEFKAMIDTVLDEVINSGAMDKLLDKYSVAPNLFYKVAKPYQMPIQK